MADKNSSIDIIIIAARVRSAAMMMMSRASSCPSRAWSARSRRWPPPPAWCRGHSLPRPRVSRGREWN